MVLKAGPITKEAMDVVRGPLRATAAHAAPAGTTVMVGGTSAVFADVGATVNRDMRVIFPVAALLILVILLVTLRSAVAPLYLLAAVVLEFGATLGATVLAFQALGGAAGLAFTLPLVLFLFVVALGTDYNILMTARLREEMLAGRPVREAVAEAVRHVAPAVGAAGLVLASSFGTLMLEADTASHQQGFALAAGHPARLVRRLLGARAGAHRDRRPAGLGLREGRSDLPVVVLDALAAAHSDPAVSRIRAV